MSPHLRRAAATLVAAVMLASSLVASPLSARACACGAVVADAKVAGEVGLVTWDGRHQTIDMLMGLTQSVKDAAWIMPTPKGAQLSLGEEESLTTLEDLTAPRIVHKRSYRPSLTWLWGNRSGGDAAALAARPPVEVVGATRVGPFQVTTIGGTSATAVSDWLGKHGYPTRPDLAPALAQYLDQGWVLQAVKLVPKTTSEEFDGALPPLRLSFATTRPIYPMRLSSKATLGQRVRLYLIARESLAIDQQAAPTQPLSRIFAGSVDPSEIFTRVPVDLQEARLTVYEGTLAPDKITHDYTFVTDSSIEDYQRTRVVVDDVGATVTGLALFLTLLAAPIGVIVLVVRRVGRVTRAP